MARALTPQDAYKIMTALVHQATGQTGLTVTDTSSFVSAGETVLATGKENVLNSLSLLGFRSYIASRPHRAKLTLMEQMDTGIYSNRMRKISFYSKNPLPSGNYNTNIFTNLAEGFGHGANNGQSTRSQWEQHQPLVLEMNFAGSATWQYCQTLYENQIQVAFKDPAEFAKLWAGMLLEARNDIEREREAWNRMTLLNKIGAIADGTGGKVINLTEEFNSRFNTNYTSAQLRSTYLKDFLAFFTATFKLESDYMTESSVERHNPMTKYRTEVDPETGLEAQVECNILRETPYDRQRVYLYTPLFREAESLVLPEIFHDNYLKQSEQYEPITFWQSQSSRSAVNIIPAVYDAVTGTQVAGDPVSIPYVVGLITDVDGMMTNFQAEFSRSTPVEARKGYRNVWTTFLKGAINDPTENAVLFIMEDPAPEPAPLNVSLAPGSNLTLSAVVDGEATLTGELAKNENDAYVVDFVITGNTSTPIIKYGAMSPAEDLVLDGPNTYKATIDPVAYSRGTSYVQATSSNDMIKVILDITLAE